MFIRGAQNACWLGRRRMDKDGCKQCSGGQGRPFQRSGCRASRQLVLHICQAHIGRRKAAVIPWREALWLAVRLDSDDMIIGSICKRMMAQELRTTSSNCGRRRRGAIVRVLLGLYSSARTSVEVISRVRLPSSLFLRRCRGQVWVSLHPAGFAASRAARS